MRSRLVHLARSLAVVLLALALTTLAVTAPQPHATSVPPPIPVVQAA